MHRSKPAVLATLILGIVVGSGASAAHAGCTTRDEARAVTRSLARTLECSYRQLRSGPEVRCDEVPAPPACAGALVENAELLTYGPNLSPATGVDGRELREQLRCQNAIRRGVLGYLRVKMRDLVRGQSPEKTAERAERRLRNLSRQCSVWPEQDASGLVLPAVGVQCAAAIENPSQAVDPTALADCLNTLLGTWGERAGPDPQPLRPNIVLILTDDQRWDTTDGTHSPSGAFIMPHTRAALAEQGVELSNAFITTPVCCPSRASILSGQYAHRSGVYTNVGPNGGADDFDDSSSMGIWLQAAGYRTGFYGKYLNGYRDLWDEGLGETPYVPPGWSEWHAFVWPSYFDYTIVDQSEGDPVGTSEYGGAEEDYSTDVLRRLAVEFIESTPADQPFFLFLNFKAPHKPLTPAPRHDGSFAHFPPWRPPSHNEADVSDKPSWVQATPPLQDADLDLLDDTRIKQLEMLRAVDEAIDGAEIFGTKSIMRALRDAGIEDDSIVIFLSDNGWMWGEHRMDKKSKPYEGAIRTPMLVRYPKLAPLPRTEDRFALNIDLAPTLVELAGAVVSPPIVQDGVSLLGLLDATARDWRTDFLTEGWAAGQVWATVREERWKYTELPIVPGDPTTDFELELYDLWNDPYELDSLHALPEHAARIDAMAARLGELRPSWPGDSAPLEEDPDE
jgi:N-acetylglucosamine-6-sulfatase